MKRILKSLILGGLIMSLSFSCDDDDESIENIPFEILDGLTVCRDGCYIQYVPYRDTTVLVKNQSQYEQLYFCYQSELPVIDFENYVLLAGSKAVNILCPSIVEQNVYKQGETIVFNVLIDDRYGFTGVGNAYCHALIPKKYENLKFIFETTFIE